jgi:reactive intermediate/imine deaminase
MPSSSAPTAKSRRPKTCAAKLDKLGIPSSLRIEAHVQVGPFRTHEKPRRRAPNSRNWASMAASRLPSNNESEPMSRKIISTAAAPAAIGTYSQAVQVGDTVYMSGQIGLDPATMTMVEGIDAQIVRVFDNLKAVAEAAGATLNDAVKLNIYLTDLANFAKVNETMAKYFSQPFPARAAVGVKELPRGALVEADAVLVLG